VAEGVCHWPLPAEVQALGWVFSEYFTFSFSVAFVQRSILIHRIITVNLMNWNTQTQLTLVLSGKKVNGQQDSGIQKKVITLMIGSKSIFL